MTVTDPAGDALRAEASAAREEIRAAGISCPSCSVNMADLPEGHMLVIWGDDPGPWTAECREGGSVDLAASVPMADAEFAAWKNAANIALHDDFRRREEAAFRRMILEGERTGA